MPPETTPEERASIKTLKQARKGLLDDADQAAAEAARLEGVAAEYRRVAREKRNAADDLRAAMEAIEQNG